MAAPKPHTVAVDPDGYYAVTSGRSGDVHRVTPYAYGMGAACSCEGFRRAGRCSHVDAVIAHVLRTVTAVAK